MSRPPGSGAHDAAYASLPPRAAGALPTPLTSFVGREREIADVASLLDRPDVRLLTLTGPGGVGKTRLAIEVARAMAPDFADGVIFVRLSAVRDPELAPAAVARAVGARESGSLARHLGEEHLLLLLDNIEHLLDQPPIWIADLLATCPLLTVFVTSREALNISGEHRFLVPPLPLPDQGAGTDAPPAAAALFELRARALRPEMQLTDRNIDAIVAICRAVDGLPLAIELAASRIVLLTPDEIARHLSNRLRLLAGGLRDAPERMRSMRATFDWSYDLLSPEEQRLLRQVSVFVGQFDLAAAGAVVATEGFDLVSGIASLVDKSLLRAAIPEGGGEASYSMLETLREYGLERLAASAEEAAVRDRHAAWYLDLTESFASTHEQVQQSAPDAVERLDREYGNVRAALEGLDASGREVELTLLAMRLRSFWYLTERYAEALRWYERARATDDATRIALLRMAGQMAQLLGQRDAAHKLEASLALARVAGDRYQEAEALFHLAIMAEDRGDFGEALAGFEQARDLFARAGNRLGATQSDYHLGVIAYGRGQLAEAERSLGDAVAAAAEVGDPLLAAWCTTYRILVACEQQELDRATHLLAQVTSPLAMPALRHHVPDFLAATGVIAAGAERPEIAARLIGASRRSGYLFKLPERLAYERAEAAARAALGDDVFEREQAIGRRLSAASLTAEIDQVASGAPPPARPPQAPSGDTPALTEREMEVLRLLAEGLTNRQIADALFVSLRTAATHVDHILTKLDVRTRTAAVAYAVRHGLA
jgi:non-specific serine/threonine protein kinase